MGAPGSDIGAFGLALALLAYGAFAAFLIVSGRLRDADHRSRAAFIGAIGATACWAGAALAGHLWSGTALVAAVALLDLVRYGLWFAFLLSLFHATEPAGGARMLSLLRRLAAICLLSALLLQGAEVTSGLGALAARLRIAALLSLPVCGLLMIEQAFRSLAHDSRWNAKPVYLGLGLLFAFDVYLYSDALLFGYFDADADSARGVTHALAVPFLLVASRRGTAWIARLQVSRTAAFHSVTLILAGIYLLFVSAVGYYVRYFGGTWGRALQLGLLAAGIALLGMLVFSGALRSRLRVFVGKHFYSYRFDYREEWLRFTAMLSSKRSPQEMGETIVRGLAMMVECPSGSLWTRHGAQGGYLQVAAWKMPRVEQSEPADASLCIFLRANGWVVDLDEFRASPRRYGALAMPTWLLSAPNAWLVVPLLVGDELLGFAVLGRPLTATKLNWEVLDLLKTAGRQAAGYLAQMQAAEELLEARKFDAFNRMSAFVVHDLKNIVAQLSLMLKNAERLHDNPEFQQDMLLTVGSSLEKMRRLMLQLREGATPPGGTRGVELEPLVRRLADMARAQGRKLEVEQLAPLSTRGHDDRLERVLGHLVQNALDATPPNGRVWIKVGRYSGQVQVEVGDSGQGMTEDFVRTRLFRPFNTTKHSGMGIGSYESSQYIRELGGSLSVKSQPGEGTVIHVLLPLFESAVEAPVMRAVGP